MRRLPGAALCVGVVLLATASILGVVCKVRAAAAARPMAAALLRPIPADAPPQVKADIKILMWSVLPWHRYEAAEDLAGMGKRAAPAIPFLLSSLHDQFPLVVGDLEGTSPGEAASQALSNIGEPAVGPVISAMSDPNPVVRRYVPLILREIYPRVKDKRIPDALLSALRDRDPKVEENAAAAIAQYPDRRAIKYLLRLLDRGNDEVRDQAAHALSNMPDIQELGPLLKALHDKDYAVRYYTVQALFFIKDPRALRAVIHATHADPSREVRHEAAALFKDCARNLAQKAYFAPVLFKAFKEGNGVVREAVLPVFGEMRAKDGHLNIRAAKLIIAAFKDPDPKVREAASQYMELAYASLPRFSREDRGAGASEENRLTMSLIASLKDSDSTARMKAVSMLFHSYCRTRDPKILAALLPAIHDPSPKVRKAAASIRPCDEEVRRIVERLLTDPSAQVRRAAAQFLGPGSVEVLIPALRDEDAGVRATAAESLGRAKDPRAVMPLIDLIRSRKARATKEQTGSHFRFRRITVQPENAAVEALGVIGDPRAANVLIGILKDKQEDTGLRCQAARALGFIKGRRVAGALLPALKSSNVLLRRTAAESLGWTKDRQAAGPLIEALKDEDPYVREDAARSLSLIGDRSAVGPLIEVLGDRDARVISAAANSLGRLRDPRAVEPLIRLLKNAKGQQANWVGTALQNITMANPGNDAEKWQEWWRKNRAACIKFDEIEKNWAHGANVGYLGTIGRYAHDPDPYTRGRAIYALRHFPAGDVLGLLDAGLKDKDPDVRVFATLALEQLSDPRSSGPLIDALKDDNPQVRSTVICALSNIPGRKITTRLVSALKDDNDSVQVEARWALEKRKDPAAIKPLIILLGQKRKQLCNTALEVLKELTGRNFGLDTKRWTQWWQENKTKQVLGKYSALRNRSNRESGRHLTQV